MGVSRSNPCLSAGRLSPSAVLGALSLSKGILRVLVLSAVEESDRGVEWVDFLLSHGIACRTEKGQLGIQDHSNRDGLEKWPHSPFGRKSVHEDRLP